MFTEYHPDYRERRAKAYDEHESFGRIYSYGSKAVEMAAQKFYNEGRHQIEPYTLRFMPNPFLWQYDLEVFIFLNYKALHARELEIAKDAGDEKRYSEVEKYGLTGMPPHEHVFQAAKIRWPSYTEDDGSISGNFVRHPWIEDDIKALMNYTFVICFGGAGQGKTHGFITFMCMIWDHFIQTDKGAKCSFSTVSEDKLKNAAWPYLQRLYGSSVQDANRKYSLYAGTGNIITDYTIKRVGGRAKDTGGVFRGILVGRNTDQQSVVDKLTGTHGHPAAAYLIDEAQSTPPAPIEASANYLSSPRHGWVMMSGNYGQDSDQLAKNGTPKQGWENVDETTHIWESNTITGNTACVIHKNNDLSPAMEEPWATLTPFLPSREKKERLYPTEASRKTEAYRRFWIGWRSSDNVEGYCISADMVKRGGADAPFLFGSIRNRVNHLSFDSAPADSDRNVLTPFHDGYERDTGTWVWGFSEARALEKATVSQTYYRESTEQILMIAEEIGVRSGNMILDWTNRGGHLEFLEERGFVTEALVYNEAPPDGVRKNERTKVVEPEIVAEIDAKGVPTRWAHSTCVNRITMGAYALRAYIMLGVVKGINKRMLEGIESLGLLNDFEQELFRRKLELVPCTRWGDREKLEKKRIFMDEFGFSPDILDTMFQAAYYMWVHRGMPVYQKVVADEYADSRPIKTPDTGEADIQKINDLWNDDSIGDAEPVETGYSVYSSIDEIGE